MTAAALDLDTLVPGESFPAPLHLLVPPAISSTGAAAVELAARAGLELDPWQAWVLDLLLRRDELGKWAASTVGLIVPRQNGKGSILEARELAGLFLLGERRIVHTAHRFVPTARDAYVRLTSLIEQTPDLRRRVRSMPAGKGDQGVYLRNGAELLFLARSGAGAGRGLWGDVIVLDEAYEIPDEIPEAMVPTMAARSIHGNPQLIYTSSPVNQEQHRHGRVLTRVRVRALQGTPRLLWVEWAAGDRKQLSDVDLRRMRTDPDALARANPGLGVRISAAWVEETERPSLGVRGYEVERLGIGDYPNLDDEATWDVIPEAAWTARQGARLRPGPPARPDDPAPWLTLGVAASYPDAEHMSISACWADGDDLVVELIDRRPGHSWVIPELTRLAAELEAGEDDRLLAVAVAKDGPTEVILPDLADVEFPVMLLDGPEQRQAAAGFKADVDGDRPRLRHYSQPAQDDSVGAAGKHHSGDGWRWDRNALSDPVEASSNARHAHVVRFRGGEDLDDTIH